MFVSEKSLGKMFAREKSLGKCSKKVATGNVTYGPPYLKYTNWNLNNSKTKDDICPVSCNDLKENVCQKFNYVRTVCKLPPTINCGRYYLLIEI